MACPGSKYVVSNTLRSPYGQWISNYKRKSIISTSTCDYRRQYELIFPHDVGKYSKSNIKVFYTFVFAFFWVCLAVTMIDATRLEVNKNETLKWKK